jgi:hypothetical protein
MHSEHGKTLQERILAVFHKATQDLLDHANQKKILSNIGRQLARASMKNL